MATAGGAAVSPFIVVPLFLPICSRNKLCAAATAVQFICLTRNYIEAIANDFSPKTPSFLISVYYLL